MSRKLPEKAVCFFCEQDAYDGEPCTVYLPRVHMPRALRVARGNAGLMEGLEDHELAPQLPVHMRLRGRKHDAAE